VFVVDTVDLSL